MRAWVGPNDDDEIDVAPVSLVVDTNVFLELHSCHDLTKIVNRRHAGRTDPTTDVIDHPDVRYRIVRAREAVLFAIHLDRIGATSWSLRTEPVAKLAEYVPPGGNASMELHFTQAFIYFVKDHVLGNWNLVFDKNDDHLAGDAADLAILAYAERNAIPIVTNEGVTADGIIETKRTNMRRRGQGRGVRVFSTREYRAQLDVSEAIESFLNRFYAEASKYLTTVRRDGDGWRELLQWVYGYYKLILLGEVEGRDTPLTFE